MEPESPRRRPRARPPAAPDEEPAGSPDPGPAPAQRRNPFAVVVGAALLIVVAVIVVAFATGTADDLPWGAIIGVVAVLAFAWVAGRRRRRLISGDDEHGS